MLQISTKSGYVCRFASEKFDSAPLGFFLIKKKYIFFIINEKHMRIVLYD